MAIRRFLQGRCAYMNPASHPSETWEQCSSITLLRTFSFSKSRINTLARCARASYHGIRSHIIYEGWAVTDDDEIWDTAWSAPCHLTYGA